MAVTDFLFGGTAPTPATSSTTTSVQYPEWYADYSKDLLGRAQAISNLPYAQYTGPRIAGFTPAEQQGFQMTQQAAGAYQPFLQQAGTALGGAMQTFPKAAATYMSPYTQNVVNQIADVGVRQLQEKFLPAVGEEFIKAGQFGPGRGSSRMGEFGARALRDVQEGVLAEQAKALESGYKTAADIFGQDVQAQRLAAGEAGSLAGLAQKYGLTGAEAYGGTGEAERRMQQANLELAYKDFLAQRDYPQQQLQFMSNIAGGLKVPSVTSTQQTTMAAQPAGPSAIEKGISGFTGVQEILNKLKGFTGSGGTDYSGYFGGDTAASDAFLRSIGLKK